jgi:hypothetical protein
MISKGGLIEISKICTKCHKEKPLTDFSFKGKGGKGKIGKRSWCYECNLLMNRLAGYCHNREKLTVLEFRQMYEDQQGQCACCGIPIMLEKCDIDHNHATGQIRSLVCRKCNIMIGHIENGEYMTAVKYLEKCS